MRHLTSGLAITGILALLLCGCGGGGGSGSSSSSSGGANTAPVANAGPAQTVNSSATVTLNGSASTDANGTISTYAWMQTAGTAVTLSNAAATQPTFTAPAVTSITTLTFSLVVTDNAGAPSNASTVNVTVNPPVVGNVNITGRVQFARVPFNTSTPFGLNYGSPVMRASRGVIVRAVNDANGNVLATGVTNDLGDYSLSVTGSVSINIEVVARMQKTGAAPTWDVRVQDGVPGTTPFVYEDGPFNSGSGVTRNINIPTGVNATGAATGTRASAPFAILDTIYTAQQAVIGVSPTLAFPTLIVDWGSQSAGTFFSTDTAQHIALLSDLTEDTDEFDQHVVAHEFGHYIEFNFSRADNIGGSHGLGDRLDPRVAFGEGFGYAFAAIVLNDPNARDSFVNGTTPVSGGFNIETNPNGTNGCWCSESSVWSILYDIADTAADSNDTLALGLAPIWQVLIGAQRTSPAFTTIFTFVTALKTQLPANAAAINTLVAAQNIDSPTIDAFATTETHFPPNVPQIAALPVYTTATIGGGPVVLRTVNDAGTHNKLGARRFVRFNVASTRNVQVTLATSNPDANQDPDFIIWRAGTFVGSSTNAPPGPEVRTFNSLPAGTYLIDVYDCANGCSPAEGSAGDYDLTVTLN